MSSATLTTGGLDDHFFSVLEKAILQADYVDLAVSFIRISGLRCIMPLLEDLLQNYPKTENGSKNLPHWSAKSQRNSPIRILTGDYLDITDIESLRQLLILQDLGAEVHIFETKNEISFHPKVYIFTKLKDGLTTDGQAWIGSSNISQSAFRDGIEWNLCIKQKNDPVNFDHIRLKFDELFHHSRCLKLKDEWINEYSQRRQTLTFPFHEKHEIPKPRDIQLEALENLQKTREQGLEKGLVVLATGLGKTWLAAFDCQATKAKKILFVAHREEILMQARKTFAIISPESSQGFYNGNEKNHHCDILFASIQSLGKEKNLQQFSPRYFDYMIVDEFHHAAAKSYTNLIHYFKPKFMLGMTATPRRTDNINIIALLDGNLIHETSLTAGINLGELCPFTYFGIHDLHVDYKEIPWRGKFSEEELTKALATQKRAAHILHEWRQKKQKCTLAFCISKRHADFMAAYFTKAGVNCAAVYSGSKIRRSEALDSLKTAKLQVLFSVDLFNEGTDLPAIDTILMLRPTESKILFMQQLGRGLRLFDQKERLHILDFIGNHKSFLRKPEALFDLKNSSAKTIRKLIKRLQSGDVKIANACYINYDLESLDIMKGLSKSVTSLEIDLYNSFKDEHKNRPTAADLFVRGARFPKLRNTYGSWFDFVRQNDHLSELQEQCLELYRDFFIEIEKTAMTKSFKMVCLEAMIILKGFTKAPSIEELAMESLKIILKRNNLLPDLHNQFKEPHNIWREQKAIWIKYWHTNPINAWIGGNKNSGKKFFNLSINNHFIFTQQVPIKLTECFRELIDELLNFRLVTYEPRLVGNIQGDKSVVSRELPIINNPLENERFITCVPYYDFFAAAGNFSEFQNPDFCERWLEIKDISKDMFVIQIKGHSMEPKISDGALCLFRSGDALGGSRQGKDLLVQHRDINDPDNGGQFTLKRYSSRKTYNQNGWQHEKITLSPLNKDYDNIELVPDEDFRVLGVFEKVLEWPELIE